MSEIRQTSTLEEIELPEAPVVSFGELLADLLRTQRGTVCAVGPNVPSFVGKMPSVTSATAEVKDFPVPAISARDALISMSACKSLEVPVIKQAAVTEHMATLIARNDNAGVARLGQKLVSDRQERVTRALTPKVMKACQTIGFSPKALSSDTVVVAQRQGSSQRITIEVAKAKSGGVSLHFDAHGFHGDGCVQALDKLEKELQMQGVRYRIENRLRKRERPVYDQRRVPGSHHIHQI